MLETPEIPKAFELLLQQAGWDGVSWEGENAVLSCPNCASSDNLRIKRVNGSGGVTDYLVSCFTPECTAYEAICALRHERGVRFPGDETNFRYSRDGRKYKLKLRYILSKPLGKRRAGDRMFAWHHWNGTEFVTAQVAKDAGIYSEWTPLYNLEAAKRASPLSEIWLSEGETDVDAHRRNGVIAVSHPDGAKPISDEQAREIAALAGKVVICGDKDLAGYIAMAQWYEALRAAGAHVDIRIPSGNAKDAKRHYALGGTPEDFVATTPEKLRSERDKRRKLARARSGISEATPEPDSNEAPSSADMPSGMSDSEMADRFCAEHSHELRYISEEDCWLHWRDGRWKEDSYEYAIYLSDQLARQLLSEAEEALRDSGSDEKAQKSAKGMARAARSRCSSAAVASVIKLARARKPIVTKRAKFDRNPELLNLPNGTYDLETRTLRPHASEDMITKVTKGRYDPDARSPEFDAYLAKVQPSAKMRELLWQVLGSSLSGYPGDHAFFWSGVGANGKSTMLSLALNALGEYGGMAEPRILDRRSEDAHTTANTDLIGKRMVGLIYPGSKSVSAEALKLLVDEPTITARRMREDNKTMLATHTFQICVNGAPPVAGSDEGSLRRIRCIDWDVTVPIAERDNRLRSRLITTTADYLVTQMIEGYYRWNPQDEPMELSAGTEQYLRSSNRGYAFFSDCMIRNEKASTPLPLIEEAAKKWCDEIGEPVFTANRLGRILRENGGEQGRSTKDEEGKRARLWLGIALKPE